MKRRLAEISRRNNMDQIPLLRHLTVAQVQQLDTVLGQLLLVSEFGTITLTVDKGRLKFIAPAPSIQAVCEVGKNGV